MLFVPFFFFFYLTVNNQIYGIDSWYWLSFGFFKPAYANLISLFMWLSIFFFFSFVKDRKQSAFLIASLYLLNFFSLRFLEPELDDYLMYFASFSILVFLKNTNIIDHRLFALAIVMFYSFAHGNFLGLIGQNTYYTELAINPLVYLLYVPAIILLHDNKMNKILFAILLLSTIYMSVKFVSNALPILIFSAYLDLLSVEKLVIRRNILNYVLIITFIIFILQPIVTVNANTSAFLKYCDKNSKICNNDDIDGMMYGHYFAWLGYIANNTSHYGVCKCIANGCLNKTIVCGGSVTS
jgi:hypothetical protein